MKAAGLTDQKALEEAVYELDKLVYTSYQDGYDEGFRNGTYVDFSDDW